MGDRPKVIVADGSSMFRMYFSTVLNRMNFEALPVAHGQDVLPLAQVVRPDLLVLDVQIEDGAGLDLLRELRKHPDLSRTPVIMLSASGIEEDACRQAGCCSFLVKPVDLRLLNAALQHCYPEQVNRRENLRAPLNRKLYCRADREEFECMAVTLSEGGIFLRRSPPLPVGTRIEVELVLGRRELMLATGEVIYIKEQHEGVFSSPPGMAVRFDPLEVGSQARLSEEVAYLLAGDIVQAQVEPVVSLG